MGIRGVESSAPEVKKRRMATLYVGNLAWSTTAETLTACLAANGTVTNVDTGTVRNGRTRGWAIVECSDQDAANNIIQMCNGQDCDGRTLTVRLDNKPEGNQSKGEGGGGKGGGGGGGGGGKGGQRQGDPALVNKPEASTGKQIVVRNLAWNVTSDMLRGTFEQIGTVQDAEVIYHQDSGRSKGWGTVAFATQEDAQDAIQRFGGVELASRPMVVRMDRFN